MTIEEKLNNLPINSGVYLMYDKFSNVIYVGKAKNLRNRVKQYFNNSPKNNKVTAMVNSVSDFGYIITLSEKDALSLESNLIKKYMPKYNILLKDDKASPYIKINLKNDFPYLEITRKITSDGSKYFGPFMAGIRVKDIILIVKSAYKIRTCQKKLKKKECLNYHINLCSAPCINQINKDDYKLIVEKVISFLSGKDDEASKIIEGKMLDASMREDFENAINYREQLAMLKKLKERNVADLTKNENIDSIAYISKDYNTALSINIVRGGKMMGVRNFILNDASIEKSESISSFIVQYYMQNEIPPLILFNTEFDYLGLKEYLSIKKDVEISFPQKGVKRKLIDMAEKNALDFLENNIQKALIQDEMTINACERLKDILRIKSARVIECYDVSNLSGVDNVASRVVFVNGVAFKSAYRRYKIQSFVGQDDFSSLKEVLLRRFKTKEKEELFPDLIVIDGGKGQLKASLEALNERNIRADIISLAKRDEIIYTLDGEISLSKSDYALRLLQRIRDEAHRFAITYNRTLRTKKIFEKGKKGKEGKEERQGGQ